MMRCGAVRRAAVSFSVGRIRDIGEEVCALVTEGGGTD